MYQGEGCKEVAKPAMVLGRGITLLGAGARFVLEKVSGAIAREMSKSDPSKDK